MQGRTAYVRSIQVRLLLVLDGGTECWAGALAGAAAAGVGVFPFWPAKSKSLPKTLTPVQPKAVVR